MDLDSDLQTSQFDYIYSCSRGIRFVGSQDVILASRPSLFKKNVPYNKMCCFISLFLLIHWVNLLTGGDTTGSGLTKAPTRCEQTDGSTAGKTCGFVYRGLSEQKEVAL